MLIYAIDDEPNMLYLLHESIVEAMPEAKIRDFTLGSEAVKRLEEGGERPDAVFSDIRMPGLSGMELASRLKRAAPKTKLVFVTGYDYAADAYQLHVDGYIFKPAEAERIREELEHLFPEGLGESERLRVRCFGNFEVFWRGQPLAFGRKPTRELFAYLVDRQGALCSSDEIIAAIWEDAGDLKNARHRIRNYASDLKSSLKSIGMRDALVTQGQLVAVRMDRLDCDYFRALAGDASAREAFRGEYMEQYSWAEKTKASLHFGFSGKRR